MTKGSIGRGRNTCGVNRDTVAKSLLTAEGRWNALGGRHGALARHTLPVPLDLLHGPLDRQPPLVERRRARQRCQQRVVEEHWCLLIRNPRRGDTPCVVLWAQGTGQERSDLWDRARVMSR